MEGFLRRSAGKGSSRHRQVVENRYEEAGMSGANVRGNDNNLLVAEQNTRKIFAVVTRVAFFVIFSKLLELFDLQVNLRIIEDPPHSSRIPHEK
jgi:hypothetical protein